MSNESSFTVNRLDEIRQRLIHYCPGLYELKLSQNKNQLMEAGFKPGDSLNFISNAHLDILWLLAEVEKSERELRKTKGQGE